MIEEGISYPLRGENALGRIFVGGLLGIFGFLIVPLLALFGYLLRVLARSARDPDADPPAFEDWGGLIVEGLKGVVVAIAYGIVPFLVLGFVGVLGAAGAASESGTARAVLGAVGAVGAIVGLLVMVVLYYILPAALTRAALEGRIGAAFEVGALGRVLTSGSYLIAWLLPFVIAVAVNFAMIAFIVVTLGVGVLVVLVVGPFVQFYVQLVVFYMFGRAYGAATGTAA